MIFTFKPGSHLSGNAQIVGEALEAIRTAGDGLTPEAVVEVAGAEAHPLHTYFEWEDDVAAEKYRLDQARHLIRSIDVVLERPNRPATETRAFVAVTKESGERAFESTAVALNRDDYRRQVLDDARRDLRAIRERYRELTELSAVFEEITKLEQQLEDQSIPA